MNYNICIDFGTCNSVVSYVEDGILKQIHDDINGDVLIPSTIYFIKSNIKSGTKISNLKFGDDYLIGNVSISQVNAKQRLGILFFQFKRFLGITSKSIDGYKDFLTKYNLDYTSDEDTIYFYIKTHESSESGESGESTKIKFSICDLIKLYFQGLKNMIQDRIKDLKHMEKYK